LAFSLSSGNKKKKGAVYGLAIISRSTLINNTETCGAFLKIQTFYNVIFLSGPGFSISGRGLRSQDHAVPYYTETQVTWHGLNYIQEKVVSMIMLFQMETRIFISLFSSLASDSFIITHRLQVIVSNSNQTASIFIADPSLQIEITYGKNWVRVHKKWSMKEWKKIEYSTSL